MNILIQYFSDRTYKILLLDDENPSKCLATLDSYKTFQGAMNQTIKRYSKEFFVSMEKKEIIE